MTRLNRSTDCGNSPKNKMVEDIGIALETYDTEFLTTILDPDVVWDSTSSKNTSAKDVLNALSTQSKPTALTVNHVMSHGKVGAVNGLAEHGKEDYRFCHVIEFTSTKCNRLKRIESYSS